MIGLPDKPVGYIPASLPHRFQVLLRWDIGVVQVIVHPLNGESDVIKATLPAIPGGIQMALELAQDLLKGKGK